MNKQPFNDHNPDGPLELCTCSECGTPLMLDDKLGRIRVIVPNIMGSQERANVQKAVSDITALEGSLSLYKMDNYDST